MTFSKAEPDRASPIAPDTERERREQQKQQQEERESANGRRRQPQDACACKAGSSCTAASTSGITYPLTVSGTATKFFNAAVNSGLGKIDVTPTLDVFIPGNAFAGTYTSTVTLAAATGP